MDKNKTKLIMASLEKKKKFNNKKKDQLYELREKSLL